MALQIQGKQMDIGDALSTHIEDKLNDITEKYFNNATDMTVFVSKEKNHLIKSHISIRMGGGIVIEATAEAGDAYAAFDQSATKAAKRLRRYKKRLRDHHMRVDHTPDAAALEARNYVLAAEAELEDENADYAESEEPTVVAEMALAIPTLSVSEAVMRMDLAELPAMMFRSSKHGGLNMVYRRNDGHIGWVDPDGASQVLAQSVNGE